MPGSRPRSTLAGQIANELTEMILNGRFKPGEFLPPQKDLADELGVGISTIREAIQVLSAMGMLEARAGKGTWVPEDALEYLIKPATVRSRLGELNAAMVCETRSVIEVALTEFAAMRADNEEADRIWKALHRMETHVNDAEAFVQSDLEFHLAVAEASHNDLLKQLYHLSRNLLEDVIAELVHPMKVRQDSIELQRAIAGAIEKHNREEARSAALAHMHQIATMIDAYEQV